MNIVYGLVDPRDGSLRYVGRTKNGQRRFSDHSSQARTGVQSHLYNWIRTLQAAGLSFNSVVIQECDPDILDSAEIFWISYFKAAGHRLTNQMPGGAGGYRPNKTAQAAQRAAKFGKRASLETRMKMSRAHTGRSHTAEALAKISLAMVGNRNRTGHGY